MVYAKDLWIQLPVRDIYDSQIMMASINAARDMYEKGVEQIKDFRKQYGDFFSPIQKDMDWYNDNVIDGSRNLINDLYDKGIDPTRSAEGRAIISKFINDIPSGEINKMKLSAAAAQEFIKNRDLLSAQGKYSPELDAMMGGGPENWDTINNGIFYRSAPIEAKTLQEFVHPSFLHIQPHMLTKEEVESRGHEYDPKYDYVGISENDMRNSMKDWMPGVRGNVYYKFYREQAKLDLLRKGIENPSEDLIDELFVNNAITADKQVMTPLNKTANPYAQMDYRDKIDDDNAARDHQYQLLRMRELHAMEMRLAAQRAAASGKSGGGRGSSGSRAQYGEEPYSFVEALIRENLAGNAGVSVSNYDPVKLSIGNDARLVKQFKAYGDDTLNHLFRKNVDAEEFTNYFGNAKYGQNSIYASKQDVLDLYTSGGLSSTMYGTNKKHILTMPYNYRKRLENLATSGKLILKTTNRSGVVKHNGAGKNKYRLQLYFEVEAFEVDRENKTTKRLGTMYLDSGAGTYEERGKTGTVGNVVGSITERNRSNIVTTRDQRVSNKVRGSKKLPYDTNNINGQ